MDIYKKHDDAAQVVRRKLNHKFFAQRARDMLHFAALLKSHDGSTPIACHRIRVDHVNPEWPREGSITITRDDGVRFKLLMGSREFRVIELA